METQQEIQQLLVDETLNLIDGLIKNAKVIIDGKVIMKDVHFTTKKGDTLRKYVYLDTEAGLITRASLLDSQGRELYIKEPNYQKSGQQGYMIAFPIQQKLEVVTQ